MTDKPHFPRSARPSAFQLSRTEFRQQLVLFWETAQPLKRILDILPSLGEGLHSKMQIRFPRDSWSQQATLESLMQASIESEIVTTFQNLPEDLFERLALRFRPFFANNETTSFLKVLACVARYWPELKPWQKNYKERWHRAVFWGAMEMPERTPPVKADAVIEAGFYSRYFHVSSERRIEAKKYESSLGKDIFRAALVSAVWQRSKLVIEVADEFEGALSRNGALDDETRQRALELHQQPEHIVLTLKGGPGAIQVTPLVDGNSPDRGS